MTSSVIRGEVVHSDLKGSFICSGRQLTPKEIKDGFKLLKSKENAIKDQGSVHYWNHWDIVYGQSVGRVSQGWSIKCKHCAVHLGTSNTSATIQRHITSCSTERVWSRMRYLYRPQRNKLSPVKAKKILLVSIANTFEENMSKKQRLLPQEEMDEGASDLEDDDSSHPDIFLEGVDLDALDEDFFDLRDCLENVQDQQGQETLAIDESVALD